MKKGISLIVCAVVSISTVEAGFMDAITNAGVSAISGNGGSGTSDKVSNTGPIPTLTKNLGIDSTQAIGGTTALLGLAASSMPKSNFDTIVSSVPGLSSISSGSTGGMLGSALSMAGGGGIEKNFQALGMDSAMISKFAPLLLEYAKPYIDSKNLSLLQQAWSAFL